MTTPTKLEILENRYTGKGDPMPNGFQRAPDDQSRSDQYAENLIGRAYFQDTGCNLAPSCFDCPFERCQLEVSVAEQTVARNVLIWETHKKYTRAAKRSKAHNPRIVQRIAEEQGMAARTIHRIVKDARNGIGITFTPEKEPVVYAHTFLTEGLFKQGMTWKKPIPKY
jgi:hypothetical protein